MTAEQLKTIEAELQKRGYKKWTTALTSSEDWAWFKTFGKKQDEDGEVTYGYQIAFRVWDGSKYPGCPKEHPYGFDFWTSALGADSRMNFESNWEPICDIATFERMAEEFNQMVRKFVNPENKKDERQNNHHLTLGKQEKDGIDLKKLNEMLDDTLKKETKESLNQWLSEKDADTVTIKKSKYYQLCKCGRYMANWVPYFDVCPICGEYNQRGCICINCDNDKNWNNGE